MREPVEVHPVESDAMMPYAPAKRVGSDADVLHFSGVTALSLYHDHPHVPEQTVVAPREQ